MLLNHLLERRSTRKTWVQQTLRKIKMIQIVTIRNTIISIINKAIIILKMQKNIVRRARKMKMKKVS
jgi:hypothetical protein